MTNTPVSPIHVTRYQEGIYYEETYVLVARLEAIRMLLAYASIMNLKIYQMDVKSSFLNGLIQEEVYENNPQFLKIQISQIMFID